MTASPLQWAVYVLGRGRRRAWCELSGGHRYRVNGIVYVRAEDHRRALAVKLVCARCGHEIGWRSVTQMTPAEGETP